MLLFCAPLDLRIFRPCKLRSQSRNRRLYFLRGLVQDRLKLSKEALESYTRFLEASQGKNPDQEFQARQRVKLLEKVVGKR